jgi:MAF protein
MKQRQLILASASPRRKELFALTGLNNEQMSVEVDERPQPGEDPIGFVTRVAREKGQEASYKVTAPYLIIAADTIVSKGKRILGKPKDPGDAKRILQDLSGRSHRVITSLAFVDSDRDKIEFDQCETAVPVRQLLLEEIVEYVATGSPMDKAGAYGIQDNDFHPVEIEELHGCYANVMGLPLCHLTRSIKKYGLEPLTDVPEACQAFTNYKCTVYPDILDFQT